MLKNAVELFNNQETVARRIEELKQTGYHDADMYVICKGEHRIDNLKGHLKTLADEKPVADQSLWERFRNLTGAQEEFQSAFSKLGIEEQDMESYLEAIETGQILLVIANFEE